MSEVEVGQAVTLAAQTKHDADFSPRTAGVSAAGVVGVAVPLSNVMNPSRKS